MSFNLQFIDPRNPSDVNDLNGILLDARSDILETLRKALPGLIRRCPSIASMRDNNELGFAYGLPVSAINTLQDAVVDALVQAESIRVNRIDERNGKFTVELRFRGNVIYRALNQPGFRNFQTPASPAMAFVAELQRGHGDYSVTITIDTHHADKLELTPVAVSYDTANKQRWLKELGDQKDAIAQAVCESLHGDWTVRTVEANPLDQTMASVLGTPYVGELEKFDPALKAAGGQNE